MQTMKWIQTGRDYVLLTPNNRLCGLLITMDDKILDRQEKEAEKANMKAREGNELRSLCKK